jgi:hypothetical protein
VINNSPHTGFPMSAHLSRLRLFQRHLRSLVWVWVWVWDWIYSHTSLRTRFPSSRHPPGTHYPFPPRSLVCGGQTSLRVHTSRGSSYLIAHVLHYPQSSSPHAHSFVLGTAVINNNSSLVPRRDGKTSLQRPQQHCQPFDVKRACQCARAN